MNKNVVLFMMGGSGTRFGEKIPKQFTKIGESDLPIFALILRQLNNISTIDDIVVVTHPDYYDYTIEIIADCNIYNIKSVIKGGQGRSKDILSAMETIREEYLDSDNVLMYDATHPFVDEYGFNQVISAIDEYGAATLAEFQYDTTYMMNEETHVIEKVIPRKKVIAGASPEGFKFGPIYDIYKNTEESKLNNLTSAGAIALANNMSMKVIETQVPNLKITYKKDMEIVKQLSDYYFEDKQIEKKIK